MNIYADTFHIKLTVTVHVCKTKQAYNCPVNEDIVLEIQIRSLIWFMYDVIICFFGPSDTSTQVQSTTQRNEHYLPWISTKMAKVILLGVFTII